MKAEVSVLVQLAVTELATNAVCASCMIPGPYLRLWLCADRDAVLVQVWDAADSMPVRQNASPGADHGRGLVIVDAPGKDWGAYRPAAANGKVVWSLVAA